MSLDLAEQLRNGPPAERPPSKCIICAWIRNHEDRDLAEAFREAFAGGLWNTTQMQEKLAAAGMQVGFSTAARHHKGRGHHDAR